MSAFFFRNGLNSSACMLAPSAMNRFVSIDAILLVLMLAEAAVPSDVLIGHVRISPLEARHQHYRYQLINCSQEGGIRTFAVPSIAQYTPRRNRHSNTGKPTWTTFDRTRFDSRQASRPCRLPQVVPSLSLPTVDIQHSGRRSRRRRRLLLQG
jgi:hypothetical protein